MKITLYQNISERNQMDKTLTKVKDIDGKFKQSTNIMSPVLVLSYATLPDFNYIYIEELARYYFVDSITSINEGLWQINCSEDVLETYKTGIKKLNAYVLRNENRYNKKLIDKQMVPNCNKEYFLINKVTDLGLFKNSSFVTETTAEGGIQSEPNISSETDAFCYTISFGNKYPGGVDVEFNEQWSDNKIIGDKLMEPIDYVESFNGKYPDSFSGMYTYDSFNRTYAINNNNLQAIGSLFDSKISVPQNESRLYNDIMSMVNSLRVYPFSIPRYYELSGVNTASLPRGNYVDNDNDVTKGPYNQNINVVVLGDQMIENKITPEYQYPGREGAKYLSGWLIPPQTVSCTIGQLNLRDIYDTGINDDYDYLSYDPYLKLHLYVPYFGFIDLETNAVMGNIIDLILSVDFSTGGATLFICKKFLDIYSGNNEKIVIDIRSTTLGQDLPIGSSNINELKRQQDFAALNTVVGGVTSAIKVGASFAVNPLAGVFALGSGLAQLGSNVVNQERANTAPVSTTIKGNTSGTGLSALVSPKSIYLVAEKIVLETTTDDYESFKGMPLEKSVVLSNLHGYTLVGEVHVRGNEFAKATKQEIEAIEQTLKSGFILS
jgi:hypothetical protein